MKHPRIIIRRTPSNEVVTFNNVNILKEAASLLHLELIETTTISECIRVGTKNDIYIVIVDTDVVALWIRGRRRICNWFQGIIPEESYMRNKSKLRYYILSLMEKFALDKSSINLLVSQAMLSHYNTKYHKIYDKKSYIFPCFNTKLNENAFFYSGKYSSNTFVYAGGLDVWQCFDYTLEVYKSFEDLEIKGTKLIVMTKDQEFAKRKIQQTGIKHCEVGFTTPEQLPSVLAKAKFGFVLRDDTPVNRVSTPTKISTYLSCGIIPIYSECISAFNTVAKNMNYVLPWNGDDDSYRRVMSMMSKMIDANDVLNEYNRIFETYYSNDNHVEHIAALLKRLV